MGREELELLTLHEESRALQTALELAETQEKQKNDTIFRYILYFVSLFIQLCYLKKLDVLNTLYITIMIYCTQILVVFFIQFTVQILHR